MTTAASKADFQTVLDAGLQRLREAGLQAQGQVVAGTAVEEIARAAKAVQADLIVLGHKHLKVGRRAGGAARRCRRA